MIKAYLKELQDLQMYAFEHGINMEIGTRNTNTNDPWFTVALIVEGASWTAINGKHMCTQLYYCDVMSPEDNKESLDKSITTIKNFINEHSK